ncbi:MAG: class II fumarate hydratase [Spirochaetales bacterium]|nr:class II fumarate hydratase [Spirochaetales bacterium]
MNTRVETDSMGEVTISEEAWWGAQTQRALDNFQISPYRIPAQYLSALALVKRASAKVNEKLGLLSVENAELIRGAAQVIEKGGYLDQFPLDVFQTGSGTSWNMNINEVIANLANFKAGVGRGSKVPVHPNDHVNRGQSSNDVIPTAMNISVRIAAEKLQSALSVLSEGITLKAEEFKTIPKLGRTHLQDAVPMTLGQEFSGWAAQMKKSGERLGRCFSSLEELAIGGTALGTGINTPPDFGIRVAAFIAEETGIPFRQAENLFEAIAARDSMLELMGAVNSTSVSLMKIAQDLRILSSGPRSGLGEIQLPSLQPGSSIMPGKINPVIPEMVIQAAAHVSGKYTSVTIACQNSPLELNIMQPLLIHETLGALELLTETCGSFLDKCISGITADRQRCMEAIEWSLAVVTPLAVKIGYDKAAKIAYRAFEEKRKVRDIASEEKVLPEDELDAVFEIGSML